MSQKQKAHMMSYVTEFRKQGHKSKKRAIAKDDSKNRKHRDSCFFSWEEDDDYVL